MPYTAQSGKAALLFQEFFGISQHDIRSSRTTLGHISNQHAYMVITGDCSCVDFAHLKQASYVVRQRSGYPRLLATLNLPHMHKNSKERVNLINRIKWQLVDEFCPAFRGDFIFTLQSHLHDNFIGAKVTEGLNSL